MWSIKKSFEFDYGHRVWTQNLKEDFSCDSELKCRFLHGHRGVVEVTLSKRTLDRAGMVTDFKHLNWFKKFLDMVIDHKTLVDINDPAVRILFPLIDTVTLITDESRDYSVFPQMSNSLLQEIYGGIVIVNFVPTSENLSAWLQGIVKREMSKLDPQLSVEITFSETPSSSAHYC